MDGRIKQDLTRQNVAGHIPRRSYLTLLHVTADLRRYLTKVSMKPKNIFESIPENLNEEIFEELVQGKNIKIERIITKGHTSPESGWYDQERDEWVIVLKGAAVISFEAGEDVSLGEGNYLNIPAHTKHKVSWTNPEIETVWLAIHY